MLILHKTNRDGALHIFKNGFTERSLLRGDEFPLFINDWCMIDHNEIDNVECNMFFFWKGEIVCVNHDFTLDGMQPDKLYKIGSWKCYIKEPEYGNLVFIGSSITVEPEKGDDKFYRVVSDMIDKPIDVHSQNEQPS